MVAPGGPEVLRAGGLISVSRQSEEEGRLYFTMDDGQTRFADLIQLVEFHQINRGILPCKLRHYCTCVAL